MPQSPLLPVAFVTPAFPPDRGSLALAAARLARQLRKYLQLDVIVLGRTDPTPSVTSTNVADIPMLHVVAPSWAEVQQHAFWLLRERGPYRCLHGIYPSLTGFPVALAARHFSTPYLLAARGNDLHRDSFDPERQGGLLFALQHANAVVGVSRELCRLAVTLGATGRVRWIPNGVDSVRFRPALPDPTLLAELRLSEVFPQIGFAGEARHNKGLTTALQALALVRRRHPRAGLVLIGGMREEAQPALREFLVRYPELRSAVHQLPWLPHHHLAAYYNLLDLFWHPTLSVGLPNAVLEALACGRVVIASRVGGTVDILGGSPLVPLLIPPNNPLALAETTLRLLQMSPEKRATLGKAGREWVMSRFAMETEARAYIELYAELAAESTPAAAMQPPE
ncbi:MAG: glycosyltransferase [Candidatus Competibacter sp.]|nr:glycosyltransferase [Candidatus Competibacter sp.]